MVALVPLPGYVAKLLQDVQRTRMKKVRQWERLQLIVTDAPGL